MRLAVVLHGRDVHGTNSWPIFDLLPNYAAPAPTFPLGSAALHESPLGNPRGVHRGYCKNNGTVNEVTYVYRALLSQLEAAGAFRFDAIINVYRWSPPGIAPPAVEDATALNLLLTMEPPC